MKEKIILVSSVFISLALIFFALSWGGEQSSGDVVREENGVQIISVLARGGYSPGEIVAKAGVPTRLDVATKGTYDCSSALVIPSLDYQKFLPSTGVTSIDIPAQSSGAKINGLCSMGMYSFEIVFK